MAMKRGCRVHSARAERIARARLGLQGNEDLLLAGGKRGGTTAQARRAIPLGPRVRWQKGEPSVLKQDRLVLESAQPWYDADGGAFERNVVADASTLMARSVVQLAAQGRWPADRGALPTRRVVRLRA